LHCGEKVAVFTLTKSLKKVSAALNFRKRFHFSLRSQEGVTDIIGAK
jgi:hypothetical protein